MTFYESITIGKYGIGEDDVIFSRKGKVGYARLHPPNVRLAMTHTLCIIMPNKKKVLPKYLLHFCRSNTFIHWLIGTMNNNVGVPTLGLGVIRKAPFNLPDVREQLDIIKYLDDLQSKIDALTILQAKTAAELDAMLPSILDRAFKGEL